MTSQRDLLPPPDNSVQPHTGGRRRGPGRYGCLKLGADIADTRVYKAVTLSLDIANLMKECFPTEKKSW